MPGVSHRGGTCALTEVRALRTRHASDLTDGLSRGMYTGLRV